MIRCQHRAWSTEFLAAACVLAAILGLPHFGRAEDSPSPPAVSNDLPTEKKTSGIADLKRLGSVRMPSVGQGQYGPTYPNFYQVIAPVPAAANRLFVSWKRGVGMIELPEPIPGKPAEAPEAKWIIEPVKVGAEYEKAVVDSKSPAHWAELRGIAYSKGKV